MVILRLTPVTIIGLKIFSCQIIFVLGTLLLPNTLTAEITAITPDRTITVVAEQPDVPEWKILWDRAREYVQKDQYPAASKLYSRLIKEKPNIEEANWEFCKVLLKLEDFSSAAKIIISLVEKDPLRIEYLLAAGMVNLQQKNYAPASKYFGKAYELNPDGSDSTAALAGLIDSLKGAGNDEAVFPLLEQLHIRDPENVTRLHQLARSADSLGKTAKAKIYYRELLSRRPVDDRILFKASELFEKTGSKEQAVPLWKEYIRRNKNYLPFHQKLIDFYLAAGERQEALPHLLFVENNVADKDKYQIQIAEIYLHDIGRPDKALSYYEKYLEKNPDDEGVKSNIAHIQSILANDFLSIVENDGAWLLWRDLMEVTPNRLGIYMEMAKLLEKKGKNKELLEILLIISDNKPHDDRINYKIVELYRQKREFGRALEYLKKITAAHNSTKKHFLLKGDIEELAGLEKMALASYSKALGVAKSDLDLRLKCIEKAGGLGMIKELDQFFNNSPIKHYSRKHTDFIIKYFNQLSFNSLFGKSQDMYNHFLNVFKNDPEALLDLKFHRVDTLRQQRKLRKAEQLLRKLSNSELGKTEALFKLALHAIADRNIEMSRMWYEGFENVIENSSPSTENTALKQKKDLLKIKILLAEGELPDAVHHINGLKKSAVESQNSSSKSLIYELEKELCWIYLDNKRFNECGILLKGLAEYKQFDPEIVVIHNILSEESQETIEALPPQFSLFVQKQPIISRILQVIRIEITHRAYFSAYNHLKIVSESGLDSMVSRELSAELSLKRGNFLLAIESYRTLWEQFPDEEYFFKRMVISESRRGDYKSAIADLLKNNPVLKNVDSAIAYSDLSPDFEEVLIFARMLWGDRQYEKSLKIYDLLLNPPVIDLLEKRFELEEVYYHYFTRDKSFWNSLRYLLRTEPEIVAELMEPPFLIDNLGNKSGKIIADYYELYSWQKLIMNEYLARKAIVQRNYIVAERKYKRFLDEEEESVESLADLASIYDRFGDYRKEAQVYEAMRNSGLASSELEHAIEKSSAKIRPHTGVETNFLTQSGRGGYIDLESKNVGVSLSFTPDLEKDITFLYLNSKYNETEGDDSINGSYLESTGTIDLLADTDLLFAGQAERFNGRSGTNFYYFLGLRSRLDDNFSGHIEAYKKKTDDTLDAIINNIYSDGFEIGLNGETPFGLLFGGDYRHRYYSDSNSQDQYRVYSAYSLYGEDVQLSFRYDYQYLENSETNLGTAGDSVKGNANDLYWKPQEYSEHRMTVHFEHLIKGHYGSDGLKSYYSIDNSLSYEDYDDSRNVLYTGRFDIFLEMSPHYLLKGNFIFMNSDEFENRSAHLSFLYRW